MSIATAITAAQGKVADAYTAISNKGGTLPATQNLSNMPTAIASIPAISTQKYHILDRVKDDNNNDIGTVVAIRIDANNNEYAVVVLDGQYRPSIDTYNYLNADVFVSGLPVYPYLLNAVGSQETAKYNDDQLETFLAGQPSLSSDALTYCRNMSFVIDNTTYYGEIPTFPELVAIMMYKDQVNTLDTSQSSQYIAVNKNYLSSTQYNTVSPYDIWAIMSGEFTHWYKNSSSYSLLPVLELPNN